VSATSVEQWFSGVMPPSTPTKRPTSDRLGIERVWKVLRGAPSAASGAPRRPRPAIAEAKGRTGPGQRSRKRVCRRVQPLRAAVPARQSCDDADGPIMVTGPDPHELDADGDGAACEF
jgi:hypothetical protein